MTLTSNRTGSQAQLSGRSWNTSRTAKKTAPRKKASRVRKIIKYPRFLECLSYIDDPQWRLIFEDAAYGKFPNRFNMRNDRLIYKKPKIIALELPSENEEMVQEVMNFMRKNGNIHSDRDLEKIRRQLELNSSQLEEFTWKKLDRGLRDVLIYKYAAKNKRDYQLNQAEFKQCVLTIKYGVYMKFFDNNQIKIENRQIVNIDGFCFDSEERKFYIDPAYQILPKTKTTKDRRNNQTENLVSKSYRKQMDRVLELRQKGKNQMRTEPSLTEEATSDLTENTHSQSINFHRISRHLNSATASSSDA